MKKTLSLLVTATILVTGLCGCKKEETKKETTKKATTEVTTEATEESEAETTTTKEEPDEDTELHNRIILAEALGWHDNNPSLKYFIAHLRNIEAGKIQSAERFESDNDKYLKVIAEDGTEFWILLTSGDSVDAIKNVNTGEWVVQSRR